MVRISKQGEKRHRSPRKHKKPSPKTGPKQDNMPGGFKPHLNGLAGTAFQNTLFVPKI